MFDQTFVDVRQQHTRQPFTMLASLAAQTGAIVLCVAASFLYTQTLPNAQLKSMLLAPRPPVANPPKPPETTKSSPTSSPRKFALAKIVAPLVIPKQIAPADSAPAAPDIPGAAAWQANSGTGDLGVLGAAGDLAARAPEPPKSTQSAKRNGPIRVGSILTSQLIHYVKPVYPPLAKAARIQGAVQFTALISKEGRIVNLQLVRGHPLLVKAARDAILEWRYRPTILNGEPVEVVTDIIVQFNLDM